MSASTSRHAVFFICYNNLELTKQALASIAAQDIPLDILIVDNGSTDGTAQWLTDFATFLTDSPHKITIITSPDNKSPNQWTNWALQQFFSAGYDKVLGVPNDVKLPENFYRLLAAWPRGFICGAETKESEFPRVEEPVAALQEAMPAAVTLIRRWAWEALVAKDGYFLDERYWLYASDCDLALRMAGCGIRPLQVNIPFWHHGSASWRLAPTIEGKGMLRQADADRAAFVGKWGHAVDDPQYGRSTADINFRGEPRG